MLGPILFVIYTHPISEIVSFSDDNQLYKSGNITQLPEIIHSTQSCISDVKAWMTNNQLQLNNDKTEMILIATKTVLNSDCSTVHKSGGFWHQICQHSSQPRCLSWSYSLSNSKFPPFVVSAILNFVGLVQYATICLKMSPKICWVRLFFQD